MKSPLGFALRSIRLRARYAALTASTIAMGIAACIVAGAVANAVLFTDLPYLSADRIVWIGESSQWDPETGTSLPALRRWQQTSVSLERVAAFTARSIRFTGYGVVEEVPATYVSAEFFRTLGVLPFLGRDLSPDDDRFRAAPVVLVSSPFWRARLGGRQDVLGQAIVLDGVAHVIIGVMPAAVTFPDEKTAVWMPLIPRFFQFSGADGVHLVNAIGKLRRGQTAFTSQIEIRQIETRAASEQSAERESRPYVRALREHLTRDLRPRVYVLLASALLMLLLSYVNLLSMFAAEVLRRRQMVAIYQALGAERGVVLRQLIMEAALLVSLGVLLGLELAYAILRSAAAHSFDGVPELSMATLGVREIGLGLGLGATMFCALALLAQAQLRGVNLGEALKGGTLGQSAGHTEALRRDFLVMVEVTVTVVLLASAGVLAMSFVSLARARLGFEPAGVFVAGLSRPITVLTPTEAARVRSFMSAYVEKLEHTPGLDAAAVSTESPADRNRVTSAVKSVNGGRDARVGVVAVSPAYFRVLEIPLREGRLLRMADDDGKREEVTVGLIDETLARKVFGDVRPVGRMIALADLALRIEVVGVVRSVRQGGSTATPLPQVYLPYGALPFPWVTIIVKSRMPPGVVLNSLRRAAVSLDRDQPVVQFAPLSQVMADRLDRSRFYTMVLSSFAGVSLLLTGVGLYGVVSLLVLQRRREFGIRICLGATSREIVWLVLRHMMKLTLVGVTCGVALTILSSRILTTLLYGVAPVEPVVLALCVFGVVTVAALAGWAPIRFVVRMNPALVLRSET